MNEHGVNDTVEIDEQESVLDIRNMQYPITLTESSKRSSIY